MLSLFQSSAWSGTRINLKIWHLAWPMILANISIPMLGFVDTAVIGHLPDSQFLAGTALAGLFISVIFWLLGFLRMSTTGLVAKARGEKSASSAILHLYQGLLLSVILASFILLFQSPLFSLLTFVSSDDLAMQATYASAKTYFDIRIWAAPFVLANMALSGFLIGSGKTKWVLRALIVCNVVNLFADILFVPVLSFGVAGVAFASVLAEIVQFGMMIYLIRPELKKVAVSLQSVLTGWIALLRMNGNLFIRSAVLQLCLSFMTIYATQFGSQTVAINSLIMQFFLFISFSLDGVAFALESLVGNCVGQKKQRRLRLYITQGIKMGLAFALCYAAFYVLTVDAIVWLLTDIESLKSGIAGYYIWIYLLPLSCFLSFIFDGIFVGLGWDKSMRNSMIVAALCFFSIILLSNALTDSLSNAFNYTFNCTFNNHILWAAFTTFMLARGLSQWFILRMKFKSEIKLS